MQEAVQLEMRRMIDRYFQEPHLNGLMKSFAEAVQSSLISDVTTNIHLMLGGNSPHLDKIGAIAEFIFLAYDILDDLQDNDTFDKPWMQQPHELTLNTFFGFLVAVTGELLLLKDADNGPDKLSSPLNRIMPMLGQSIGGQHNDLRQFATSEEEYLAMAQNKSGTLFQLIGMMGYSFVDPVSQETTNKVDELMHLFGTLGQIHNDIRDVQRIDEKNDILAKKRTLPIQYMLNLSPEQFPPLKMYYDNEMSKEQFLELKNECIAFIQNSGGVEYGKIILSLLYEKADAIYGSIPGLSPWKETMKMRSFGIFAP